MLVANECTIYDRTHEKMLCFEKKKGESAFQDETRTQPTIWLA
jgi:hypothetical protein